MMTKTFILIMWLIAIQVSYSIVDEAMEELELLNDPFLDKTEDDIPPAELPYDNQDELRIWFMYLWMYEILNKNL